MKTRKRLTMFGAFHKKGSVGRLYLMIKRKDGGRGLISVYECVKEEELVLFGYVKASDDWMLKSTRNGWRKQGRRGFGRCYMGSF